MSMMDESLGYYVKDGYIWEHIPGEYRLSGGFNVGIDPHEVKICEATPENIVKYHLGSPEECGKDQFGNVVYIGSKVLFYHTYWPLFNERYGFGTIIGQSNNYVYINPERDGFLGLDKDKQKYLKKSKGGFVACAYV